MKNAYIGHESQLCGVEAYRLQGGKGDNMLLYEVVNGKGLRMTVSMDRCADISRLSYKGVNCSYMSPAGYVAPAYYDRSGDHFLDSFTAGFLTTCGLTNAGVACHDEGIDYPLHGTIANTPAEHCRYEEDDEKLVVCGTVRDERIFSRCLVLGRRIVVSKLENTFYIEDTVTNTGFRTEPLCILYHCNLGYPLLDEHAVLRVNSHKVAPRDEEAGKGIDAWNIMQKPERGYKEQCFSHSINGEAVAELINAAAGVGLRMSYNAETLRYFTEWKLMGEREYVLGLEPGNTHVMGRDVMRRENALTMLEPGERTVYRLSFELMDVR